MRLKIHEYKGLLRGAGKKVSNENIAEGTGINLSTIEKILAGNAREIRGEYIDALCVYFATEMGVPLEQISLVVPEPVTIPLDLNLRPDRHGKRVGQASDAAIPLPSPETPAATPFAADAATASSLSEWPADATTGTEFSSVGKRSVSSVSDLTARQRAALLPPVAAGNGGTPGARDMQREAALEERRAKLLEQARGR